jgi:hypothetical protein
MRFYSIFNRVFLPIMKLCFIKITSKYEIKFQSLDIS